MTQRAELIPLQAGDLFLRRRLIRRIKYLGPKVQVRRVRLIYEGGKLKPKDREALAAAMSKAEEKIKGMEVLVQ